MMLTGCGYRKSGCAAEGVHLTARVWVIPAERFKSNSQHTVPLTDDLMTVLEALPRHSNGDYLFSTTNGAKPVNSSPRRGKELLDAAIGAKDWVYHEHSPHRAHASL